MEAMVKKGLSSLSSDQNAVFTYLSEAIRAEMNKKSNSKLRKNDNRTKLNANDMEALMKSFRNVMEHSKNFEVNFSEFCKIREQSISELKSISQSIGKDRFNGNIAKIVGSCVGIIGGGVLLSALLPAAAPFVMPLVVSGTTTSVLGGATTLGTSVTEIVLLKKALSKTKCILQDDQELANLVFPFMVDCDGLAECIEKVIGIEFMHTIFEDMKDVIQHCLTLKNKYYSRFFYLEKSLFVNLVPLLVRHLDSLTENSTFERESILTVICLIVSSVIFEPKNRCIFSCVISVHRFFQVNLLFKLQVGLSVAKLANLGTFVKPGSTEAGATLSRVSSAIHLGAWAGIGIALDIVNIVLASIDIHKRPIAAEAKEIAEVAEKLEKELVILKCCYEELKS